MSGLNGLVLSGGQSRRMGRDKGAIVYPHALLDQRSRCYRLLQAVCDQVLVSCRREQAGLVPGHLPLIFDAVNCSGPAAGILSAHAFAPGAAWLVMACDFPFVGEQTIRQLVAGRNRAKAATCFLNSDLVIEPLLTIWEATALRALRRDAEQILVSPRHVLESLDCEQLSMLDSRVLLNVNCPADLLRQVEPVA